MSATTAPTLPRQEGRHERVTLAASDPFGVDQALVAALDPLVAAASRSSRRPASDR